MLGRWLFTIEQILEEDVGYLHGALIDRGADTTLQNHLQNFRIGWHLIDGGVELADFLLNVFNSHLNGRQNDL